MAVDMCAPRELQLDELRLVTGDHAGVVHHLREAEHAPAPEQALQIAGLERAARRLELGGRNRGRGHEVEVEREVLARVEQPVDAVGAEHVRELVGVGDDRDGPERQHQAGELVGEKLRRLEVHVRVDEARDDPAA